MRGGAGTDAARLRAAGVTAPPRTGATWAGSIFDPPGPRRKNPRAGTPGGTQPTTDARLRRGGTPRESSPPGDPERGAIGPPEGTHALPGFPTRRPGGKWPSTRRLRLKSLPTYPAKRTQAISRPGPHRGQPTGRAAPTRVFAGAACGGRGPSTSSTRYLGVFSGDPMTRHDDRCINLGRLPCVLFAALQRIYLHPLISTQGARDYA